MSTFIELYATAKEELKAAIRELHVTDAKDASISDRIFEIADSNVPIYNSEVFSLFAAGDISYKMRDAGLMECCTDVLHVLKMRINEELIARMVANLEEYVAEYLAELEDEAETLGYNNQ